MADLHITLLFVLKSVVCFLLVLLLGFVIYLYKVHSRLNHIPGPPRDSFFLGNVPTIRSRRIKEGKNIHQTLSKWSTEYRPVFVIWFFHVPLVVVSDAEVVREVLVIKNLPKDPFGYGRFQYVFGQRFLGRGLFSDLDHTTWEVKRRTVLPAFNRNKLINDLPTMNTHCENFLKRLEELADGTTEIAMADEFLVVTLETIVKIAFSLEMDTTERSSFQTKFRNALDGVSLAFRHPSMKYKLWSKLRSQCIVGAERSRNVVSGIVEKRQKDINAGDTTPDDMLSYVLRMKDTLPGCNINDLIDMGITVIFGGMETMANHMAFTLLSICLHPDVEKRLREELDEVTGQRSLVTAEDIKSLHYLGKVMKEALRLHPPTPALTRITKEDTRIGNLIIPADLPLMVNAFVLHHHPDYWDNPESFEPDRFDMDDKLHPYAYVPFSLGPRRCPGVQLAEIEVKLVIARLLKKFSIKLIPGQSLEVAENITFCPAGGVRCTLTPNKA